MRRSLLALLLALPLCPISLVAWAGGPPTGGSATGILKSQLGQSGFPPALAANGALQLPSWATSPTPSANGQIGLNTTTGQIDFCGLGGCSNLVSTASGVTVPALAIRNIQGATGAQSFAGTYSSALPAQYYNWNAFGTATSNPLLGNIEGIGPVFNFSDNLNCHAITNCNKTGVYANLSIGAPAIGNDTALLGITTITQGATGSPTATEAAFAGVIGSGRNAGYNLGGTAGSINSSIGSFFGGNFTVWLKSGATYQHTVTGLELDTQVDTGASVALKRQLLLVPSFGNDTQQGIYEDNSLVIANPGVGLAGQPNGVRDNLLSFGEQSGAWPCGTTPTPTCTLIKGQANIYTGGGYVDTPWARHGVDFRSVVFGAVGGVPDDTSYAFSSNAFSVSGLGNLIANSISTHGISATSLAATGALSGASLALSGAGTAAAPGLTLGGDTTSGFYRPSANQVSIGLNGVQSALFQTGQTTNYANAASFIQALSRTDATLANNAVIGTIGAYGNDAGGTNYQWANIQLAAGSTAAGTDTGAIYLNTRTGTNSPLYPVALFVPSGTSAQKDYFQFASSSAGIVAASAVGVDSNIDFRITPKGTGLLDIYGTAVTAATTPSNFSATGRLQIKVNSITYWWPVDSNLW